MKTICLLLVSCFLCFSCSEIVDAGDIGDTKDFVYINGFLSPDDEFIKVRVSRAFSLFEAFDEEKENVFKNAIVTITNEDQEIVSLTYEELSLAHQIATADFPILPGKQYFLDVMVNGKNFKASCKIPVQQVEDIITKYDQRFDGSLFADNLNVKFPDLLGQDNFYILGGEIMFGEDDLRDGLFLGSNRFTTDVNGDGIMISSDTFIPGTIGDEDFTGIQLRIANVEEILYQLIRSSYLEEQNVGNPFFEPIVAPNNIEGEGGLGVFAGFRLTELEIAPPE